MASSPIDDELWQDFHSLINMSGQELREWLATQAAGEQTEDDIAQTGQERSQHIASVLAKRRTDLEDEDIALMRSVVAEIGRARGMEPETAAGDTAWRHRLMSLGHDPLRRL